MILVDFSGIMFQCIHGVCGSSKPEIKENGYDLNYIIPAVKGYILDILFGFQNSFQELGSLTICLDSHSSNWRKKILSNYKMSRKVDRDNSPIPFEDIFKAIDELLYEIKENTPWKVLKIQSAEADDVILCLADAFSKSDEILILSSDKDMIQAQKNKNVKQYSPLTKKWITPETKSDSMEYWIQEHIILGDLADEVPRITDKTEFTPEFKQYLSSIGIDTTPKEYLKLNPERVIDIEEHFNVLNKKGQKDIWKNPKIGPKTIQKLIENDQLEQWLDSNELYRPNYERNKKLVLQEHIPSYIYNESIVQYKDQDKSKINIQKFKDYLYNSGLPILAESLPVNFSSGSISIDDFI